LYYVRCSNESPALCRAFCLVCGKKFGVDIGRSSSAKPLQSDLKPYIRLEALTWIWQIGRAPCCSGECADNKKGLYGMTLNEAAVAETGRDFIRDIVKTDLDAGRVKSVVTRFPPEPNGYLHIGHAKSICLNFGLAGEFGGRCHLRFDDTNPTKEDQEYIDAIERDVRWLGFDWGKHLYHASDYFEQLYAWVEDLIRAGKAYVDDQSPHDMRVNRGTLTEPGKNSPFRDRNVEENLDLFRRMRAGEFPNGARVLRAKIDMASGNINLRDPVLYRILHASHPRTGTEWKIYPSYDFAHGQSDAIEHITHSICTLEFEDHRPLYDWFIENLKVPSRPRQYEFARLNLTYTVLSKRVLNELVRDGHVSGWDDPRMPTIAGLRRRGVPPEAIRDFVKRIGVAKANSVVDAGMFDFSVREVLNRKALRRMAVLRPLKLVIENYPEGQVEELEAANHPDDPAAGSRKIKFARELYIEQDDFMENPPKKFFRLSPGAEVRLRYAYFVTCREAVKNSKGEVVELRCTYDPATRGGNAPDGRKVKATIHWVSAAHSVPAEVRLYNPLFTRPDPSGGENFTADLNPNSLEVLGGARLEPGLADAQLEIPVQFERQGYFCLDRESKPGKPVFSRTIGLRDTWAKEKATG
jgi:glutaminyl-tRNA synthetase